MTTALTRADVLTGTKKQVEFFSDFLDSFAKTPFGDQLARVTNEKSVNQSLKNLIKTNVGERLFQPYVGSNVYATLFEMNGTENLETLKLFIESCVENHEPRVSLIQTLVESVDDVSLEITLIYNLINNPEPITFSMVLRRVR